jgi:hypothetical protein
MTQPQLIDTAPVCPLGCTAQARRAGRGWVCSGCGLEWSTLAPSAAPASGKKKGSPRQGCPPVDRKPSLTETGPVLEDPFR